MNRHSPSPDVAFERAARKAEKAARLAEIDLLLDRLPHRLYWLEEAGQIPPDFPSMVRRLSALVQECR